MATARLSICENTFCGNVSIHFGTLTKRSVQPAVPALLTSDGPLGTRIVPPHFGMGWRMPIRSLGVVQGHSAPRAPTIISRGHYYVWVPAILGDISEGTSY